MKSYRVSVYWEEVGTPAEGGMEDEQQIEIHKKPTKGQMVMLRGAMEKLLEEFGLRRKGGKR